MRRMIMLWLAVMAAAALLSSGCAGIISEKVNEEGNTERVRVGTGPGWSTFDRNATKASDSLFILKKESTF